MKTQFDFLFFKWGKVIKIQSQRHFHLSNTTFIEELTLIIINLNIIVVLLLCYRQDWNKNVFPVHVNHNLIIVLEMIYLQKCLDI